MRMLVVGAGELDAVIPLGRDDVSSASFCEAEFHCMKSLDMMVAVDEASYVM